MILSVFFLSLRTNLLIDRTAKLIHYFVLVIVCSIIFLFLALNLHNASIIPVLSMALVDHNPKIGWC
jgi:hypothetical protein